MSRSNNNNINNSNNVKTDAPVFFVEHKKGEVAEVMNLFKNPTIDRDPKKKKDIIKRVIAYMTLGVDVSKLFHEMVKASHINDIVTKKMVYMYIVNYADESDSAFIAINTFINDLKHKDPNVRGLALRSLCSMKFKGAYEYYSKFLYSSLEDSHHYVRKTAVLGLLKVYKLNPKLITEKDIDMLYDMIKDTNPMVVTNVLHVLNEIQAEEGGVEVTGKMVNHLLNYVSEYNEWGQNIILKLISKYTPKDEKNLLDILNTLEEKNFLKHSCPAIVLGTCKVFINFTKDTNLYKDVLKRIKDPLITLLSSSESSKSYEMTYTILCHINLLISKGAKESFKSNYKKFYVNVDEPYYNKKIKLEILVQLCDDNNYLDIISEMEEYVNDVSIMFSKISIISIGEVALRVKKSLDNVITLIKKFLERNVDYVVVQSMKVLEDLLRKYPDIFDNFVNMLEQSIHIISNNSSGLSALVWILGEYGEKLSASPYILESLIDNYSETESTELINSILLSSCKLFFKSPGEMQEILGKVFDFIFNSFNDIDLKDRAFYFYNLLKSNVEEAEYIICGERVVVENFINSKEELFDKIFSEFNSLSVLYNKPEEKFIKKYVDDEKEEENTTNNDNDDNEYNENINNNNSSKTNDANNSKNIINNDDENIVNIEDSNNIIKYDKSTLSGKAILKESDYEDIFYSYKQTLTKEYSPIPEEVEAEGFVGYLEENNIFVKAFNQEDETLKMYLYSLDINKNFYILTELVLNFKDSKMNYTIKHNKDNILNGYNEYLTEILDPIINFE